MSTTSMVKIGILGAGAVSSRYKEVIENEVKGASLVAICDKDLSRVDQVFPSFEGKKYDNIDDFLKDTIDLVIILTPSGLHFDHVKLALESGKNVLVEKPITLRLDHALELGRIAEKVGKALSVCHQNRYNLPVSYMKNTLAEKKLGNLKLCTVRLRWARFDDYYSNTWHGTWAMDGGVISQQAVHHLDALIWLCGGVKSVLAIQENLINPAEAEDTTLCLLRMKNGALGCIEATTAARPGDLEASISILGDKGSAIISGIALNKLDRFIIADEEHTEEDLCSTYSEDVPNGMGLSHGRLLQDLLDSIIDEKHKVPVDYNEGIEVLKLIHAIYKSAEEEKWIDLDSMPESQYLGKGKGV